MKTYRKKPTDIHAKRKIMDKNIYQSYLNDKKYSENSFMNININYYVNKFSQTYIRHNVDTDDEILANIFYQSTRNDDIKIFLKMKWNFDANI